MTSESAARVNIHVANILTQIRDDDAMYKKIEEIHRKHRHRPSTYAMQNPHPPSSRRTSRAPQSNTRKLSIFSPQSVQASNLPPPTPPNQRHRKSIVRMHEELDIPLDSHPSTSPLKSLRSRGGESGGYVSRHYVPPPPKERRFVKPFTYTRSNLVVVNSEESVFGPGTSNVSELWQTNSDFIDRNISHVQTIQEWVRHKSPPKTTRHDSHRRNVQEKHRLTLQAELSRRQHMMETSAQRRDEGVHRMQCLEHCLQRGIAFRVIITLVIGHLRWRTFEGEERVLIENAKRLWALRVLHKHILNWYRFFQNRKRRNLRRILTGMSFFSIYLKRKHKSKSIQRILSVLRSAHSGIYALRRFVQYGQCVTRCGKRFALCQSDRMELLTLQFIRKEDEMRKQVRSKAKRDTITVASIENSLLDSSSISHHASWKQIVPRVSVAVRTALVKEALSLYFLRVKITHSVWMRERRAAQESTHVQYIERLKHIWDSFHLSCMECGIGEWVPPFDPVLSGRAMLVYEPLKVLVEPRRPPFVPMLLSQPELKMLIERGIRTSEFQKELM
eukprot:PhF_6_TR32971/c0_g1_i3/m.48534